MKTTYRLFVVIALVIISWWFQGLLQEKPDIFMPVKERFADFFLDNFKITVFDENGHAQHVIRAARLDHYVDEEIAEIKQVKVEFNDDQGNWHIRADRGIIDNNQNKIEFIDNVIVSRPANQKRDALTMSTGYMLLDTQLERLSTDQQVSVTTDRSTLVAQGMLFDNKKGILTLTNKVKGTYVIQ